MKKKKSNEENSMSSEKFPQSPAAASNIIAAYAPAISDDFSPKAASLSDSINAAESSLCLQNFVSPEINSSVKKANLPLVLIL